MSRKCPLSGKTVQVGNRVSHAKNRTKVRLLPNLHVKKIYSDKLKKFIKIRVSTSALRSINKKGLDAYSAKVGFPLA